MSVALREGGRDAIYTAVLWQPPWYSHRIVYDVYAPDVEAYEPSDVPRAGDPGGNRRVVVTTRLQTLGKLPELWKRIKAGRRLHESVQVDSSTWVHVFDPE